MGKPLRSCAAFFRPGRIATPGSGKAATSGVPCGVRRRSDGYGKSKNAFSAAKLASGSKAMVTDGAGGSLSELLEQAGTSAIASGRSAARKGERWLFKARAMYSGDPSRATTRPVRSPGWRAMSVLYDVKYPSTGAARM